MSLGGGVNLPNSHLKVLGNIVFRVVTILIVNLNFFVFSLVNESFGLLPLEHQPTDAIYYSMTKVSNPSTSSAKV